MVDAKRLRDRPGALAGLEPAAGFLALMLGELGLASKPHAAGLGSLQAAFAACQDALPLILSHSAQEGDKAAPQRRGEIEVGLVEHLEQAAAVVDALDDVET